MNIIKWMGRGLLLLLASLSITLWVSVTALQMTVLSRTAVFGWLSNSGAYNHLVSSIIALQQPPEGEQNASLDMATLQQAITDTLSPSYTQQTVETILGASYDWLYGKTTNIEFSIPLSDKRDELQQRLATAIEPKLGALPPCNTSLGGLSSLEDIQCLPRGSSPKVVAAAMSQQAVGSSDFLKQPLTPQSLSINTSSFGQIPKTAQLLPWLVISLPVLAAICIAGYILLSTDRLAGARIISGRIFFSTLLTTLSGAALWYFGGNLQLSDTLAEAGQLALLNNVVEPIARQIAPALGGWVMALGGGVALISGSAWITTMVIQHKKRFPLASDLAQTPDPTETHPEEPAASKTPDHPKIKPPQL